MIQLSLTGVIYINSEIYFIRIYYLTHDEFSIFEFFQDDICYFLYLIEIVFPHARQCHKLPSFILILSKLYPQIRSFDSY